MCAPRRVRRLWMAVLLTAGVALAGAGTAEAARHYVFASTGPLYYGPSAHGSSVTAFAAAADGLLAPLVPLPPAGISWNSPSDVAPSPDGRTLYVASASGVDQFDVLSDGSVRPKGPTIAPPYGSTPQTVVVAPDGRDVYVLAAVTGYSCGVPAELVRYRVGAGGALSAAASSTAPLASSVHALLQAGGLAVSPDGRSVYAGAVLSCSTAPSYGIARYDVGSDGTLTPAQPAALPRRPFVFASGGHEMTITPDGRHLYVAIEGAVGRDVRPSATAAGIAAFDVQAGGSLAPGSFVSAPEVPSIEPRATASDGVDYLADLAVAPDGTSLYALVASDITPWGASIAQYAIGSGGGLVPRSPAVARWPFGTGRPGAIAVSPDGRAVYVGAGDLYEFVAGSSGGLRPCASLHTVGLESGSGLAVTGSAAPTPAEAPTCQVGPPAKPPALELALTHPSPARLLSRGLRMRLTCPTGCRATITLSVGRRTARTRHLRSRTIGRLSRRLPAAPQPVRLRVPVSRSARSHLRDSRRLTLTVTLRARKIGGAKPLRVVRRLELR